LQTHREKDFALQRESLPQDKENLHPEEITPGNRLETAKFGKSGGPLGNVPGNSYLCPTISLLCF